VTPDAPDEPDLDGYLADFLPEDWPYGQDR